MRLMAELARIESATGMSEPEPETTADHDQEEIFLDAADGCLNEPILSGSAVGFESI